MYETVLHLKESKSVGFVPPKAGKSGYVKGIDRRKPQLV